jgi:hypothetical protein
VKLEDLEKGDLKTSWTLETSHPSVTGEEAEKFLKTILIGTLIGSAKGAWAVSNEWNRLLSHHRFTHVEEFLAEVWEGKP